MNKMYLAALLVLGLIAVSTSPAQAQTPQETLTQYIADLQKNPNDTALREKIIKHVQMMKAAPKIPEEIDELVGQAKYVFKHAKTQEDYLGAVEAYKKIVNITPWVGDHYFNLGVAQEQSGQLGDAINSFRLYLLASPGAMDAREVRERIGGLKYAAEKAAKVPSPEEIAAKQQKEYEEWLRKIDGRRYTNPVEFGATGTLDVKSKILVTGIIVAPDSPLVGPRGYTEHDRFEIRGREAAGPVHHDPDLPGGSLQVVYIISEDGERITEQLQFGNGTIRENIYLRQR